MTARWQAVLVLALAAVLFTGRLGERGLTSEEVRWGQVAREMQRTGEWFHPTINGQLYYDKPLASYWLIVAVSQISGDVDEFAARFPSALAGLLAVLLTMHLGRRAYDSRTGILAGALLTTMFGFAVYARRASADLENLAGILAAVTLFAERQKSASHRWVVGLWVIMGVTSSMKGLLGFALPGLILGCFCIWNALISWNRKSPRTLFSTWISENRWFFNRWSLIAMPLGVALFLAPYAVSSFHSGAGEGLAMVFRENLQRFVAPHNHTGPVYLYLGVIVLLAAPWSLFLPAALIPQRTPNENATHRLIVVVVWATFLFFTASASRRSYYLLPILPATSLLIARLLMACDHELRPIAHRLRSLGHWLFALGMLAGLVALALPAESRPKPYNTLPELDGRGIAITIGLIALLVLLWRMLKKRPAILLQLAITSSTLAVAFFAWLPAAEGYRTRREFARQVCDETHCDWPHLALFHSRDIVFELAAPQPLPDFAEAADLSIALQSGSIRWAIVRRRYLPLLGFPYTVKCEEASQPWEGLDQLGDKMTLIQR